MTRRRGPSTSLRQLVALLVTFGVGLALVLATALLAPGVLRIGEPPGADTLTAGSPDELAEAAVRGDSGTAADDDGPADEQGSAGSAPADESPSAEPADEADVPPSDDEAGPDGDAEDDVPPSDDEAAPDRDDEADREPGDGADPADRGADREPRPTALGDAEPSDDVAARVVELVNAERAAAGCGALQADPVLDDLALAHSRDMAARGFFDHTTPDGLSPWDRAAAAGVAGVAAENIARGQPDAEAVVAAWMDSPGHRANILTCDLARHGLGMEPGAGGPWWTQVFGR